MKRLFIGIAILTVIFCSVNAFADNVSVQASAEKDIVTAIISTDFEFYGCSLEIVYDEKMLDFDSSSFSDELQSGSAVINPRYKNDTVKISILSLSPIQKGDICEIKFNVKKYAKGDTQITLGNTLFCDEEANEIETEKTGVTVSVASSKTHSVSSSGNKEDSVPAQPADDVILPNTTAPFKDIEDYHWAKTEIEDLCSRGIIKGISETEFSPASNIRRADYVLLIVRMLGINEEITENFSDVAPNSYYYKELGMAKSAGLIQGVGDNKFNPEGNITRQDMFVIAKRLLEQYSKGQSGDLKSIANFSDYDRISDYAKDAFSFFVTKDLVLGNNNYLKPLDNATRAETAVFIYRLDGYIKSTVN